MRFFAVTLILCGFAAPLAAQDFECQFPTCGYLFPLGLGASGDCEGVSVNAVGAITATVDTLWPCTFAQNLLMDGSDGIVFEPNPTGPPAVLTGSAEAYIPVPSGAPIVSFCWNGWSGDGTTATTGNTTWNDGIMIDVIDGFGTQLSVLVYRDSFTDPGTTGLFSAAGTCFGGGEEFSPAGLKTVTGAALPAGAAYIRVAAWSGFDAIGPSAVTVDGFDFTLPFDHSIVCTPVSAFDSDIDFSIVGGTPGSLCYIAMAAASTGVAPAGWFYGIDIAYPELVAQIAFGLPFNYVLDASGSASYTFPLLGIPCPIGITLDCVVLEFSAGPGFFSAAGPAKTVIL